MANVSKDVEALLLKERKCVRKPGEVPYPLEYSTDMRNFAHWDHMFHVSCCRSLTMHQFDSPPAMVLDLGCGSGYWAIEAAQQWTNSTIIGFDIKDIQPRLPALDLHENLATRIKWVHGNLLESLPFPQHHFDFVRIVGIGLGVPEDEWQYVLEEVARIMKPGAVLEITEEDLIFPCGRLPKPRPRPPPLTIELVVNDSAQSIVHSGRSTATLEPWSANTDDQFRYPAKSSSSLGTLHESYKSITSSTLSFNSASDAKASFRSLRHRRFYQDSPEPTHPQDHSKLKAAWDSMLSSRFLAPRLVSVLPFYLSSSSFVDVKTHHSLQIPLPPSTHAQKKNVRNNKPRTSEERFDTDFFFELKTPSQKKPSDDKSTQNRIPPWSSMHLAKTVQTVSGCKESIWVEYEKLYGNDPSVPLVTRTNRPDEVQSKALKPSSREAFERDWSNWENDMMDRIGMRGHIVSECSWKEPLGEWPDWRVWRNALDIKGSDHDGTGSLPETPDLCRSLRSFVGWKPS